jgi:hypothetical protein
MNAVSSTNNTDHFEFDLFNMYKILALIVQLIVVSVLRVKDQRKEQAITEQICPQSVILQA